MESDAFVALAVKIPMMPKGVEHCYVIHCQACLAGEDSNDAERR